MCNNSSTRAQCLRASAPYIDCRSSISGGSLRWLFTCGRRRRSHPPLHRKPKPRASHWCIEPILGQPGQPGLADAREWFFRGAYISELRLLPASPQGEYDGCRAREPHGYSHNYPAHPTYAGSLSARGLMTATTYGPISVHIQHYPRYLRHGPSVCAFLLFDRST